MKKLFFVLLLLPQLAFASEVDDVRIKAEQFFAEMTSMQADFRQVDPEGNVASGKFWLKKPGKFRWQYEKGQNLLIVGNGKTIAYVDKDLNEATYVSAENTLAAFLARKKIALSGDIVLHEAFAEKHYAKILIGLRNKPDEGKLALYFSPDFKQLLSLEVLDSADYATQIVFDQTRYDVGVSEDLFIYQDPKFKKNVWEKWYIVN